MIDITSITDDINLLDTVVPKAGNILSIQLGSLEYLPDFGIDIAFFLDEKYRFQNESFKAYMIETLASNGINVNEVVETVENLYLNMIMRVESNETNTALVG